MRGGTGKQVAIGIGIGLFVLLAVAVVAVIVSDDSEGDAYRRSEIDLQAALLAQEDIEGDYVPHQLEGEGYAVDREGGPECDALFEDFENLRGTDPDAVAVFRTEPEQYLRHALSWLDSAARRVADIESAVAACPEYRELSEGRTTTVTQELLPSGELGEAGVAYVQNWHTVRSGDEYALLGVRILWEREGVLSELVYLDPRSTVEPGDLQVEGEVDELIRGLAETADGRLEEVLEAHRWPRF